MPHFAGWTAAAVCGLAAVVLAAIFGTGCGTEPAVANDPNAGLLRDFLDGKYDSAGHPLNARVTDGAKLPGALAGGEQYGDLVANARFSIHAHGTGDVVSIEVSDDSGSLATATLTASQLRSDEVDLPASWSSTGGAVKFAMTVAGDADVELEYVEVFPQRFGLVLAPGSGVIADSDHVTFELPLDKKITAVELDGTDITDQVSDKFTQTQTTFRKLIDLAVADLPAHGDVAELRVRTINDTQRMELLRGKPACNFVGTGTKVLVTGFQPFPADASHDNVSGVAVTALGSVDGAAVMKLILPVEYDRAADEVADAIARCQPDLVISFGQGGDEIALEHTAYNLQDTGEVSGGVPDNRGIVRAAQVIDADATPTRDTLLPITDIKAALEAIGEAPAESTDPGRYICNNVMFADIGAIRAQGHGKAGFIHLPYTTEFDAATKARFAKVVATAIEASL
ncbi:MAG: hypothetical protein QM831_16915 [Kofleriaceae bacterium]